MKIVYTNMYFCTHNGNWSTRCYDFSKQWAEDENEVHVITARYYKSDLFQKSKGLYTYEIIDGIHVHIVNVEINNKHKYIKRIINFLIFNLISFFLQIRINGQKYIFSSGPITILFNSLFFMLYKKCFLEIRDLMPEGVEELGIVKSKKILLILKLFVKINYKFCSGIIVLSEGMKKYLISNYKVPSDKIITVTNSGNFELIKKCENKSIDIFLPENFFLYYGNLGAVNCTKKLVDLFIHLEKKMLHKSPNIVFIGDGQFYDYLSDISKNHKNIYVYKSLPKNKIIPIISRATACFVPLKPGPIINTSSPNKFFESLACNVPVIQSTTGWLKNIIEKNNLGYFFEFGANDKTQDLLISIDLNDPRRLNKHYYKFALKNYDKSILANRMLAFINRK